MTTPQPTEPSATQPTRRDRLRPLELLIFAGVLAVFSGLIILMATRTISLAAISAGIVFIVVAIVVALLGLGGKPSDADVEARKDLQHPDDVWH